MPYNVSNVSFENKRAGIRLAATLTMPEQPVAAVVLVSGSGPQDRDQLFMGHRTFLVLADQLSRQNIAVLRYDDRGVGDSEGIFSEATSFDFASDTSAAVNYLASLPHLNGLNIGVIGHSEGGLIAPIVATNNTKVNFIALLAGPSKQGRFISENQMKAILSSNGMPETTAIAGASITKALNDTVLAHQDLNKAQLSQKLTQTYQEKWQQLPAQAQAQLKSLGGGSLPQGRINMLTSKWYKTFLEHDPKTFIEPLTIPILALFAEKDVQIDAKTHYPDMLEMLKDKHSHSKVKILASHNHLFQVAKTGAMSEYQQIEQTLSLEVLSNLSDWIVQLPR